MRYLFSLRDLISRVTVVNTLCAVVKILVDRLGSKLTGLDSGQWGMYCGIYFRFGT
jgi:hypothetical protein